LFLNNFIIYSSVELPELTSSNSNNDITAATLIQEIKNIVNTNNHTNLNSSPFQRTVNWTFENMKMLIGSDLPIFGDEKHPAVSLRLRFVENNNNNNKPLNSFFLIEI